MAYEIGKHPLNVQEDITSFAHGDSTMNVVSRRLLIIFAWAKTYRPMSSNNLLHLKKRGSVGARQKSVLLKPSGLMGKHISSTLSLTGTPNDAPDAPPEVFDDGRMWTR